MKISLSDVIEAIEFEGELITHYYNKKTGIIMYVEDESVSNYKTEDINNLGDFEEWERELIEAIYDVKVNSKDYIQLPNREEINECGMMIEFCNSIDNDSFKSDSLENLGYDERIRKLRDHIEKAGSLNEWYDYREKEEHKLAINWCEKNNIEYIE